MKPLQVYPQFDGRCADAVRGYEAAVDAGVTAAIPHCGAPMRAQVPKERLDRIMHAEFELSGAAVRMVSSAT